MGNKAGRAKNLDNNSHTPTATPSNYTQQRKINNIDAWQALVAARVGKYLNIFLNLKIFNCWLDDIKEWLSQQNDLKKALTTEVLNQHTAMQLVVGGRTHPTSEDIIESLKVLIASGADINYIPPKCTFSNATNKLTWVVASGLVRDPVPYLAAIHTTPEVVNFLFDQGADFTLSNPELHMRGYSSLNQCSFINAIALQKLLFSAPRNESISFMQLNYPPQYHHELTVMKLDWVNYIESEVLKSTLRNLLQSRIIESFKVEPEHHSQEYATHQKTEITFELRMHVSDATKTRVTLVYESDISCNGSETFELVLNMAREHIPMSVTLSHELNAFIGTYLRQTLQRVNIST